ncbi:MULTISPECIES: hypothetical protein [unclassified Mesorhizobium]|uniref:hypothetical protein n=1 Tax=unclassified Mesorhizobium TaxID=325217 RepID=UPI0011284679|nr:MULTISPECIES: hypothetical protein [unclassified Mesorhizobium]TPK93177.1 hypothetical protein FJ567_26825 [Mesorhizobium sp. B2-4-16]TPL73229.1 hypothetical protein FJ956_10350 [Mesorhizobium sp. B2-4-3]
MTLEEFTAQLNATTFWKEFTFSQTRFFPRPKQQVELADGIVKIGSLALLFQLKERSQETADPDVERRWFQGKVLKKATSQIKDSLRYLSENEEIRLTNGQSHEIVVKGADLQDIKKIVVFLAGRSLPQDCWKTKFHVSTTAGFIHVMAAHDYLGILRTLRVPDDVRQYLEYRENVLPRLEHDGVVVEEPDIMVAFLSEKDLPEPGLRENMSAFVQDLDAFDLTFIMRDLHSRIVNPDGSTDYYRILEEFARLPRGLWREVKTRFVKSLSASKRGEAIRPFRLAFPKSDCAFMIASLDLEWPATGADGLRMRNNAVAMFTEAAKYDLKTQRGVGILMSRDGEFFHIDWCFVDEPWAPNAKMDDLLATTSLFRPTRERMVDSFLFQGCGSP